MLKIIRVAAVAVMLAVPFAARAEQPAAKPADAAMPCPNANMNGGCCGGACAEMQAKAAAEPGKADEGGCPCQRAKAAAAKAAAEQKQGQQP